MFPKISELNDIQSLAYLLKPFLPYLYIKHGINKNLLTQNTKTVNTRISINGR